MEMMLLVPFIEVIIVIMVKWIFYYVGITEIGFVQQKIPIALMEAQ